MHRVLSPPSRFTLSWFLIGLQDAQPRVAAEAYARLKNHCCPIPTKLLVK